MRKIVLLVLLLMFSFRVAAIAQTDATVAQPAEESRGLGEDLDCLGRSLVYGIGAVVIFPFRLAQDMLNAFFQGTSHEKLWDHTN